MKYAKLFVAFKKPKSVALSPTYMATKCPVFYCCT